MLMQNTGYSDEEWFHAFEPNVSEQGQARIRKLIDLDEHHQSDIDSLRDDLRNEKHDHSLATECIDDVVAVIESVQDGRFDIRQRIAGIITAYTDIEVKI